MQPWVFIGSTSQAEGNFASCRDGEEVWLADER